MMALKSATLVAALLQPVHSPCTGDAGCSLNGICQVSRGNTWCSCGSGWTGEYCEVVLDLRSREGGYRATLASAVRLSQTPPPPSRALTLKTDDHQPHRAFASAVPCSFIDSHGDAYNLSALSALNLHGSFARGTEFDTFDRHFPQCKGTKENYSVGICSVPPGCGGPAPDDCDNMVCAGSCAVGCFSGILYSVPFQYIVQPFCAIPVH